MTGKELESVTDTQQGGLDVVVQAAKAAFPHWSSKTWNERRDPIANAVEELCTILTAENSAKMDSKEFCGVQVVADRR